MKPKNPSCYPLLLHGSHNSVVKLTFWSSQGVEDGRPDLLGMVPTVDNILVLLLKSIIIQNLL